MENKICTLCFRELPATPDFFYKNNGGKNGLHSRCKLCTSKKYKKLKKNNIIQKNPVEDSIIGVTERNEKLELKREINIETLRNECNFIYKKSKKTIGYNEITVDLGDDDCGIKLDEDWHIGNEMTNINQWVEDIDLTRKIPRLFDILDGDYTDNLDAINKKYESIMSVPEAKNKVREAVILLKDKIIGIAQGCHDEWFHSQDSWDISQYLASHTKQGYWLGFRGVINIILGEQKYRIYVRHKYRRHSTDNLCWGMLYKFRKLKEPVDIMMGAHNHMPDVRIAYERDQKVYLIKGGSYKPYDRFLEHHDVDPAPALMPAVYLRSDKHEIIPFMDFKDIQNWL